jgi:hypothetical protein
VAETLAHVLNLQMIESPLFGQCRVVDYSQFTARGHYNQTTNLRRYFQAMMWLGRIDFAVAGGPFLRCASGTPQFASPRGNGRGDCAVGPVAAVRYFRKVAGLSIGQLRHLPGWSDSMNFAHLGGVLEGAGIRKIV